VSDQTYVPRLPEHPDLREIAEMIERVGMMAEILDERFGCVFVSSETARALNLSADEAHGLLGRSLIARSYHPDYAEIVRVTEETGGAWVRHNVPIMRHYVDPSDPDFERIFDAASRFAARTPPVERPPRAWHDTLSFPAHLRFRRTMLGDQQQGHLRIDDSAGDVIGFVYVYRGTLSETVLNRLGRGDPRLFERMDRVSDPARRPSAILFADLEASGELSRRLSSRGYFELVRDLTDLLDESVVTREGIVGKHAGDGGSALFVASELGGSESTAARAAIEAARTIHQGTATLGPEDADVRVNIGLHWGATLTIGQVATRGRLEVTALGDQMNECARIEAAARGGTILASKDLVERLDAGDAAAAGVDPDALAYTPLRELGGAGEKAVRDAGTIPVAAI
jgi:class 3 adenylate cyclase